MTRKRILLVDDHPLLRKGIGKLIDDQADMKVCGEAESRAGAMQAIERTRPDLAVVDLTLKDDLGLELIKDCRARFPDLPILVLSMHEEKFYAERVLRAGARGYIMKAEASEKVLTAIREVLNGGLFVSKHVSDNIVSKVTGNVALGDRHRWSALSDREMEVFVLMGKGYGPQQIAKRLHISVKTVETHRSNIKIKLGIEAKSELLQQAIVCAQQVG